MLIVKKTLDRVLSVACVFLFAVLVIVVVWQVTSRQLGSPAAWTEETARYLFVWLGFFGAALVFSERGHIAVDFLARKLPLPVQRGVGVFVQLAVIAFAVVGLVLGGWRASQGAWNQDLIALPTQVGVMYLAMPIAGALITFYAVHHVIAVLRGEEIPVEDTDESEAV